MNRKIKREHIHTHTHTPTKMEVINKEKESLELPQTKQNHNFIRSITDISVFHFEQVFLLHNQEIQF